MMVFEKLSAFYRRWSYLIGHLGLMLIGPLKLLLSKIRLMVQHYSPDLKFTSQQLEIFLTSNFVY